MGLDGLDSTPVNLNIEENHKPLKKNNRIGCDQDQNKNNPGGDQGRINSGRNVEFPGTPRGPVQVQR